jgi:tetratricopeptide (TPR) repeat protein
MESGSRNVERARRMVFSGAVLLAASAAAMAVAARAEGTPAGSGPVRGGAVGVVRVAGPAPLAAMLSTEAVVSEASSADDGSKETVRAALAEAASAKREALKLSGQERTQALLEVTARYAAIADDAGNAAAGRAEASFRAGELLRASKHLDEAAVMYARATELGADAEGGQEFAARGLLEAAHMKRRAHDVAAALTLYASVRDRFPGQKRSAAYAVTWLGKLQLQSEQREQGIATLLSFREQFPEYPVEAVRNADIVALEQLDAGDEAGARRTVDQIQHAMEGVVAQGGKQSDVVSKALAAMRVTEQLASY